MSPAHLRPTLSDDGRMQEHWSRSRPRGEGVRVVWRPRDGRPMSRARGRGRTTAPHHARHLRNVFRRARPWRPLSRGIAPLTRYGAGRRTQRYWLTPPGFGEIVALDTDAMPPCPVDSRARWRVERRG